MCVWLGVTVRWLLGEVWLPLQLAEQREIAGLDDHSCSLKGSLYQDMIKRDCQRHVEWEQAEKLFAKMHDSGVPRTRQIYNMMISVYVRSGQWAKAAHIFEQMRIEGTLVVHPILRKKFPGDCVCCC